MLQYTKLDPTFKEQVMAEPGGENLLRCLACGTCMAACLIRRVEPEYNPRRILRMAAMGLRDDVLSSPLIWLCSSCDVCYKRCPQDIHISEVMTAIRNIAIREGYERPGPVAEVDEALCSGCGVCVMACPYEAMELVTREVAGESHRLAQVNRSLCMSCGICAAACPSSAVSVEEFGDREIAMQMQAGNWFAEEAAGPKIMLFICDWCLRASADVEALRELPPDVRVVNVPCSGRVDPSFILFALAEGADGVLVVGCQPGECHYVRGTYISQGRTSLLEEVFAQMGVVDGRMRFARIGSADRGKLPRLVEEMIAEVRSLDAAHSSRQG
jgi:heterodisulfide reductase subunit C/coenzyme F420-reducing hydrogenase delta subunit